MKNNSLINDFLHATFLFLFVISSKILFPTFVLIQGLSGILLPKTRTPSDLIWDIKGFSVQSIFSYLSVVPPDPEIIWFFDWSMFVKYDVTGDVFHGWLIIWESNEGKVISDSQIKIAKIFEVRWDDIFFSLVNKFYCFLNPVDSIRLCMNEWS